MKLSEANLQNTTDEGVALCRSLLALGVPDQEIKIHSNPFRIGTGKDSEYHAGTSVVLQQTSHDFLGYIDNPNAWGHNLISIKKQVATLVVYATGKATTIYPSGFLRGNH